MLAANHGMVKARERSTSEEHASRTFPCIPALGSVIFFFFFSLSFRSK